ncbi:MAG: winged helix-turn-helix transcriptional regulator [Devosia sp.]|nr:winged helix-turn-helix transcriptional regulator [Devosia sp.]
MPLPEDNYITVIAETYRLLGDPTRLKVLLTCLEGPIAVGDIARATGASPSLVSHHLRLLRAARLVRGTRRNKQVLYEAADEHIARMLADMLEHALEEHEPHEDDDG